jgi:hypothetical protein
MPAAGPLRRDARSSRMRGVSWAEILTRKSLLGWLLRPLYYRVAWAGAGRQHHREWPRHLDRFRQRDVLEMA